MMAEHTPGPWRRVGYRVASEQETAVAECFPDAYEQAPRSVRRPALIGACLANAARIVACVNACEGINPTAVPELLKRLKVRVVDCPCVGDFAVDDHCGVCLADIAAIAKAEENQR